MGHVILVERHVLMAQMTILARHKKRFPKKTPVSQDMCGKYAPKHSDGNTECVVRT